jgi:hypothetical protein
MPDEFTNYDTVVFGDNHHPFSTAQNHVFNCGTFLRRKLDEVDIKPRVGLIRSDGTVEPYELDISQDRVAVEAVDSLSETSPELTQFLDDLRDLRLSTHDFKVLMQRVLSKPGLDRVVKQIILEAMEE